MEHQCRCRAVDAGRGILPIGRRHRALLRSLQDVGCRLGRCRRSRRVVFWLLLPERRGRDGATGTAAGPP